MPVITTRRVTRPRRCNKHSSNEAVSKQIATQAAQNGAGFGSTERDDKAPDLTITIAIAWQDGCGTVSVLGPLGTIMPKPNPSSAGVTHGGNCYRVPGAAALHC
jgi:hypothetical protein